MRLANWQTALSNYLSTYDHRFKYGEHDCFLFVAGAIAAQSGIDVSVGVTYTSRRESLAEIKRYGRSFADAFAAVVARYGILPCPAVRAHRGDPVVIQQGRRSTSLGIVSLSGKDIISVTNTGLARLPLARALQGYKL